MIPQLLTFAIGSPWLFTIMFIFACWTLVAIAWMPFHFALKVAVRVMRARRRAAL